MSGSGPTHWRRPMTKTYDYNFKLGEHYYKPQLSYIDTRKGRAKTPPTAKTFAERFAADPIYGNYSGSNLRRTGLEGLGDKYASLDDLTIGNKGSLFARGDNLDRHFSPTSPRLIVGDRLLDSVGVDEARLSSAFNSAALNASSLNSSTLNASSVNSSAALNSSSFSSKYQKQSAEDDQSSSLLSSSRRKQVGFVQSANADLSEDPFKTRVGVKLQAARKQADDMMDDMKRDADSSASSFRSRMQARREDQSRREEQSRREDQSQMQSLSSNSKSYGFFADDDDDTAAIRTRVNEIGLRAKARLAKLDDDFPDLQIGSSLAARRSANNASSFYDDNDDFSSNAASSKTVKITKRTVKASYELE